MAIFLLLIVPHLSAQDIFLFKKKHATITSYARDNYIAFQDKNGEWFTGFITRVKGDSFYIRPRVIRYHLMGSDTLYFNIQAFTLADIYAMPKKGVQIDYIGDRFQITRSGGHVHWYWVKSGWVFRVGAVGYTALNITNGLIKNNFSFEGAKLGIAAGVFLLGELLHLQYKPVLRTGKKYHFESIAVSDEKKTT